MQKYKYKAVNLKKKKFSGTFMAEDEQDLTRQLAKQGLFLTSCKVDNGGTPSAFWTLGTGKVTVAELTSFCRQFSIMLNSGMTIAETLECLKNQRFTTYFKSLLEVVYEDVKTGVMLSDAFSKHNDVFPQFFRSMIYVGEVSGRLEKVFDALADYYERDSAVRSKIKSAFSYPIMLAFMTLAIAILMLVVIIPTFRASLESLGVQPEGITKVVYNISDFLAANWLTILAIIILIILAFYLFGKTTVGRRFYDKLKITLPLFKPINIDLITARFSRGFALLLSSGVDVVEALNTMKVVIGNKEFEARYEDATEEVKHGVSLATAFANNNLFPDILLQMITIGERTASLEDVLTRSTNFFDSRLEDTLNRITSLIQPIMLLIMGIVVGGMFLAIYSPMLSIMNGLL